jgi:hypothetical protein
MHNFSDQCLDLARSLLGNNLQYVNEDGTVTPAPGEQVRVDEPGHAALAIGEFFRATGEVELGEYDLHDLTARCVTQQAFVEEANDNGMAYAALGLLSFGASKERNAVWERLLDPTREQLDRCLLARSEHDNHFQAFTIAKSVARFSFGLTKKDDTGKIIDRFVEGIEQNSSGGFCDDDPDGPTGVYDIYGLLSFIFARQALQLHANVHLKDRKLPKLRTFAEKYLRMLPDMARQDGLGWNYGRAIGAYGQLHCISMILQAMRDNWVSAEKMPLYLDTLRRLFQYFFVTYVNQEKGDLMIRDDERNTIENHTTRMANFDAARYLCQWSRLARVIGGSLAVPPPNRSKTAGRFVIFDKSHKKEHGLFLFRDENSGVQYQLPLIGPGKNTSSDNLAFPHCSGIFDWPVNKYLPVMLPELTFGDTVVIPSYYGKNCVTGIGLKKSFYLRFEQPDLVKTDGSLAHGLGSCQVQWSFGDGKVQSEFIFKVKNPISMDKMRLALVIGSPHTAHRLGTTLRQGKEGLRANVEVDDFHANWGSFETVTEDEDYRGYAGNIHYVQFLVRDHPLKMRPGQQYKLVVSYHPDVAFADE